MSNNTNTDTDRVIWFSAADGSWGGCERRDLIIVSESDLTDDDNAAIEEADGDEEAVFQILLAVQSRKAEKE